MNLEIILRARVGTCRQRLMLCRIHLKLYCLIQIYLHEFILLLIIMNKETIMGFWGFGVCVTLTEPLITAEPLKYPVN